MFVVISRRMISTSQWSGPETNVGHTAKFASPVCCARTLFKPSLPKSHSALVVKGSGERRTPRITRRDTAQTERTLTRPVVTTRLWMDVCVEPKSLAHHPRMDCLIVCCRRPRSRHDVAENMAAGSAELTLDHDGVDTVLHIMEARRPMVTGPRQPTCSRMRVRKLRRSRSRQQASQEVKVAERADGRHWGDVLE